MKPDPCSIYLKTIVHQKTSNELICIFCLQFQRTPGAWANSVQFTAPSSNPYENINPSIRLYELDRISHQLLDYVQYRMDFSNISSGGR